jgi:hypothetical protein
MSFRPRLLCLFAPVAAISTCVGCAAATGADATSPHAAAFGPTPRRDAATICVVHPATLLDFSTYTAADNGTPMGTNGGDDYFCYYAEPGNHTISSHHSGSSGAEVKLVAEAGRRYWLQQSSSTSRFGGGFLSRSHFVSRDGLWTLDEPHATSLLGDCDCGYSGPPSFAFARAAASDPAPQ